MNRTAAPRPATAESRTATIRPTPGKSPNPRCLGHKYGKCEDWEHCPYCSELEQAMRAIPGNVLDF